MDVRKAATDPAYVRKKKQILKKYKLQCWALGAHLAGQCVGDDWDERLDGFAPAAVKGKPDKLRAWAVDEMKATARAAKAMGCCVVNGFMGSPIWKYIYAFPPTTEEMIEAGFDKVLSALDADPRRLRRGRREIRPRGPSDRDRLRFLHRRAAFSPSSSGGRPSASISIRATSSGRAWSPTSSSASSPTGSTTST